MASLPGAIRDTLPAGPVGPAQERSRALIEISGSASRLQGEDVGRIAAIGKAQLAQVSHGDIAENRYSVERHARFTAHLRRNRRRDPAIGEQLEGGGRHP